MRIRSGVVLAALAFSFALPMFAQQNSKPDPQLREALLALAKKFEEAWNNNTLHARRGG